MASAIADLPEYVQNRSSAGSILTRRRSDSLNARKPVLGTFSEDLLVRRRPNLKKLGVEVV